MTSMDSNEPRSAGAPANRSRRRLVAAAGALPLLAPAGIARADDYPNRTIRMIIPFAPGGTTDLLARGIANHLSRAWGQSVVPENRPGANGIIAADMVAKSPGDGYTLHVVAMGHAVNPLIYRKLPFDTDKDFTPVSLIATFPQLVLTHPSVNAKSLQELLALARSSASPLSYASGGVGSSQHLAGALFTHMAKVRMTHVPYKGGNPALMDVIGGSVNMIIMQPSSREMVTTGQVRALAVSSAKRSSHYPDVPTVSEAGVPDYQSVAWYGVVAPGGLPAPVLKKISEETARAIRSDAVRKIVDAQGGDLVGSTADEFGAFITAERKRYETTVREAGIALD